MVAELAERCLNVVHSLGVLVSWLIHVITADNELCYNRIYEDINLSIFHIARVVFFLALALIPLSETCHITKFIRKHYNRSSHYLRIISSILPLVIRWCISEKCDEGIEDLLSHIPTWFNFISISFNILCRIIISVCKIDIENKIEKFSTMIMDRCQGKIRRNIENTEDLESGTFSANNVRQDQEQEETLLD